MALDLRLSHLSNRITVLELANPLVVVLIALTPAAAVLWRGRAIVGHLQDPALPERLMTNRSRNSVVFGVCAALLIILASHALVWAVPLLIAARMLAAYPIRKTLYGEVWGVGAYLSFYIRLIIATFGFWMLLATIPYLTMRVEAGDWMIGFVLATIAICWNAGYSTVFRAVLNSKPIDDPALVARFRALVSRCGFRAVALERVDLQGGTFANAIALPSLNAPAVVISEPLASRLDQDETVAILGHELAHLEYYNARRLRRNYVITCALIIVGAFSVPVLRVAAPQMTDAVSYLWPLVLLSSMILRARHRQKHETESDLRAVELTGNADALVRALCKTYASSLLPRRWDHETERHATHPSLARRIQAIRSASGAAQASLGEAATFAASKGSASVTFLDDRIQWAEENGGSHTISYKALKELRIRMHGSDSPRLVGVDLANRRWELMLKADDVRRVQSVLDVVDGHLGAADAPPFLPVRVARVLALLATMTALSVAHFSMLIAAVLALARPAAQLTAAAGAAAITSAALAWRDRRVDYPGAEEWQVLFLLICGLVLIGISVASRRDAEDALVTRLVGVLSIAAAAMWVVVLLLGLSAVDLHTSARDFPSIAILTMSLAGAFVFAKQPKVRWATLPLAVAAMLAGYLGSTAFAERFIADPLVAPAASLNVTTLTPPTLNAFPIDFTASDLWLSPAGRYVAFQSEDEDERLTIHAGRAGGELTDFSADEAVFVSEDRLLLVERQRRDSALHLVDLRSDGHELWTVRVPLSWGSISIDRESQRWRMVGRNEAGNIESIEGLLQNDEQRHTEWSSPAEEGDGMEMLGVSGNAAVGLERRHLPGLLSGGYLSTWMLLVQPQPRSEIHFWALDEHGPTRFATSRFDPSCRQSSEINRPGMCAAFDGVRTRFFTVDPASHTLTSVASADGRFLLNGHSEHGWLSGWWERAPAVLRPTTHEALRVSETAGERLSHLAIADSAIASISYNYATRESTVRIYSLR